MRREEVWHTLHHIFETLQVKLEQRHHFHYLSHASLGAIGGEMCRDLLLKPRAIRCRATEFIAMPANPGAF